MNKLVDAASILKMRSRRPAADIGAKPCWSSAAPQFCIGPWGTQQFGKLVERISAARDQNAIDTARGQLFGEGAPRSLGRTRNDDPRAVTLR
jgi:hypothetical protein